MEEDLRAKQEKKSKMNTKYDKYIEQFFPIEKDNQKNQSAELQKVDEDEVAEQTCCEKCC